MGATVAEHGPAVSRLCIATAPGDCTPLSAIQESGGFYRLHLMTDPADGAEFAVAAPGLDEVSLITDLIAAMRRRVTIMPGPTRSVLAGFHVGIIRLTGDRFGGAGVERTLSLIRDPAVTAQASMQLAASVPEPAGGYLAVVITAGFFDDLCTEGLTDSEWRPVPTADAWLRLFQPE